MLEAGVPVGVLVHMKLKQGQDQFEWGSSRPAVRLGSGWSLEDMGWADVTGLVGLLTRLGLLSNLLSFVFVKSRDDRLVRWWWEGMWYSVALG